MSASVSASPGGQPSTTQPIAGPCDSPKDVTANSLPIVLPDMDENALRGACADYSTQHLPFRTTPKRVMSAMRLLEKLHASREGFAGTAQSHAIHIECSSVNACVPLAA